MGSAGPGSADVSPATVQNLYGFQNATVNGGPVLTGTGQTIVLVEAQNDPYLQSDLNTFDSYWGLPGTTLNVVPYNAGPYGTVQDVASDDPQNFALEASLDVQWAHAMAPGATIDVVEAPIGSGLGVAAVVDSIMLAAAYGATLSGVSAVSMSFGLPEGYFSNETQYDGRFLTPTGHSPVTFIASSGDTPSSGAQYPAASPNVLSVGGTMLNSSSQEVAWLSPHGSGSEGGISAAEAHPGFQDDTYFPPRNRITPDVAFLASSVSIVSQFNTQGGGGSGPWLSGVEGTSLSAPCWAGLIAIVNQGRASQGFGPTDVTLGALYDLLRPVGAFNDITSGSNGVDSASAGYDDVTGWGSPSVPKIVRYLSNLIVVKGTSGGTSIGASVSGSTLTVTQNGTPSTYTTHPLTAMFVKLTGSGNSVNINGTVTFPTVILGGTTGSDTILGGGGNDVIDGRGATGDSLSGGPGTDLLMAGGSSTGGGHDTLAGNGGNDTLVGGVSGADLLQGGNDNDLLIANNGFADTLDSGLGTDTCYRDSLDSLTGTFASNQLVQSGWVDIFENYVVG